MLLSVQGLAVLMDHTGKPRRNSVYGKSHRCFVTRGRKIIEVREETGKEEPAKKTHSGKFNSSYYIGGKHATVVIASLHIRWGNNYPSHPRAKGQFPLPASDGTEWVHSRCSTSNHLSNPRRPHVNMRQTQAERTRMRRRKRKFASATGRAVNWRRRRRVRMHSRAGYVALSKLRALTIIVLWRSSVQCLKPRILSGRTEVIL